MLAHTRGRLAAVAAAVLLAAGIPAGVALTAGPAGAATCTASLGGGCGYDYYPANPMSNGYNTYVEDQGVGPNAGTTSQITATAANSWSALVNAVPYGYGGVQVFDADQQLMNDWCTDGSGWQPQTGCTSLESTPYDGVSSLTVSYTEQSPQDANSIYEYAADTWPTTYGDDIMFWAYTHGRCNEGSYGSTILAPAVVFGGQTWTLNRYGGPGAELIWVLDSNPAVPDSCAQQPTGTIDIKAAYDWMVANGIVGAGGAWNEVDAGWEITSADNTTFSVSGYQVTGTVAGTSPSPSPSSTSASPSPSPSPTPTASASPSPSPSPSPSGGVLVGDTNVEPSADSNVAGMAEAFAYTAAASGTSATASFYVDSSSTATAGDLGVYTDAGGSPGTLLGQAAFTPAPGWDTVTLPGVAITAGQSYWLAELGTSGTLAFRDQGAGASSQTSASDTLTALPATWAPGQSWPSGQASLYLSAPASTTAIAAPFDWSGRRWCPDYKAGASCAAVQHPPQYTVAFSPAQVSRDSAGHIRLAMDWPARLSGAVNSYGLGSYRPGTWARSRLYLPCVAGQVANWPAFWLEPVAGGPGEIDVAEGMFGHMSWHYHYTNAAGQKASVGWRVPGNWCGWHTYAVWRGASVLRFYYDGALVGKVTAAQLGVLLTAGRDYVKYDYGAGKVSGPLAAHAAMRLAWFSAS